MGRSSLSSPPPSSFLCSSFSCLPYDGWHQCFRYFDEHLCALSLSLSHSLSQKSSLCWQAIIVTMSTIFCDPRDGAVTHQNYQCLSFQGSMGWKVASVKRDMHFRIQSWSRTPLLRPKLIWKCRVFEWLLYMGKPRHLSSVIIWLQFSPLPLLSLKAGGTFLPCLGIAISCFPLTVFNHFQQHKKMPVFTNIITTLT